MALREYQCREKTNVLQNNRQELRLEPRARPGPSQVLRKCCRFVFLSTGPFSKRKGEEEWGKEKREGGKGEKRGERKEEGGEEKKRGEKERRGGGIQTWEKKRMVTLGKGCAAVLLFILNSPKWLPSPARPPFKRKSQKYAPFRGAYASTSVIFF